jgi:hypothetical protein
MRLCQLYDAESGLPGAVVTGGLAALDEKSHVPLSALASSQPEPLASLDTGAEIEAAAFADLWRALVADTTGTLLLLLTCVA